jgi:hypothetical protein
MEMIQFFDSGGRLSLCFNDRDQHGFEAIFMDRDRPVAEFLHDLLCIILSKEYGLGYKAALARSLGPQEASRGSCLLPVVSAVAEYYVAV